MAVTTSAMTNYARRPIHRLAFSQTLRTQTSGATIGLPASEAGRRGTRASQFRVRMESKLMIEAVIWISAGCSPPRFRGFLRVSRLERGLPADIIRPPMPESSWKNLRNSSERSGVEPSNRLFAA